jgi:hypothetical protein
MENGSFSDDLPFLTMMIFHSYAANYQRVGQHQWI